jgi:hypothetical protein
VVSLFADQGNEAARNIFGDEGCSLFFLDEQEPLTVRGSNWNHEATTFLKLCEQSCWEIRSGGGDDDGVEGGALGKTKAAVANMDVDIGVAEVMKHCLCESGQRGLALDGIDVSGKFGQ